jgi:hypothetical protein
METRSRTKAVSQEVLTTSFVEEVSETLPTVQKTFPTLQHAPLVAEDFPKSKYPLPTTLTIQHAPLVSEESPPPVQRKQQLVEEFLESKFPLSSKTTHFSISMEEPNHPIPTCNLSSPKTPKPELSPSSQTNKLASAIKKLGKIMLDFKRFNLKC